MVKYTSTYTPGSNYMPTDSIRIYVNGALEHLLEYSTIPTNVLRNYSTMNWIRTDLNKTKKKNNNNNKVSTEMNATKVFVKKACHAPFMS